MHISNNIDFGKMKVLDERVYCGSMMPREMGEEYLTSNAVLEGLMELVVLGEGA